MTIDSKAALFVMLGQTAERSVEALDTIAPTESLLLSSSYDLAALIPNGVKQAIRAAEAYKKTSGSELSLR